MLMDESEAFCDSLRWLRDRLLVSMQEVGECGLLASLRCFLSLLLLASRVRILSFMWSGLSMQPL